jgi:hypothetical protein
MGCVASATCFSDGETFEILWSLLEAIDLAEQVEALSTMAMLDGTYRTVRGRFDETREE